MPWRRIAACIHNLSIRWRHVIIFTPTSYTPYYYSQESRPGGPWSHTGCFNRNYPLDKRLGGPQRHIGCFMPYYQLDRRLGRPESQPACCGEFSLPPDQESNPSHIYCFYRVHYCNNIISRRILKHSNPAANSSIQPCNNAIVLDRSFCSNTSRIDILWNLLKNIKNQYHSCPHSSIWIPSLCLGGLGNAKATTNSNVNFISRLYKQQHKLHLEATQTAYI
jgi:hypothetical protein